MGSCNSSPFNSIVGMIWFSAFALEGGRIFYLKLHNIMIFLYKTMCHLVTCVSPHFMHVPQFWIS